MGGSGTHDYFLDSLPITTTSRTSTATPITVQIHIPPPDQPPIHPSVLFIIKFLSLREANPVQAVRRVSGPMAGYTATN